LIIALSSRVRKQLHTFGIDEDRTAIIRSGVSTEKFHPRSEKETKFFKETLGFESNDAIITYFGPLTSFRGADTAISCMSEIQKKIPSAKLLLLARGPLNRETRIYRKATKTKGTVLVPGILSEEELIRYLSISDVITLPFKFWPQVECPLTILEAMAMGKPIVTTKFGAIPEIVENGQNGMTIRPGNKEEQAQAVTTLLLDRKKSREIGTKASVYVQRHHDWKVIARTTLEAYEKALG
jgi:glycosyltransferase involved in cell wall biosynthesis